MMRGLAFAPGLIALRRGMALVIHGATHGFAVTPRLIAPRRQMSLLAILIRKFLEPVALDLRLRFFFLQYLQTAAGHAIMQF